MSAEDPSAHQGGNDDQHIVDLDKNRSLFDLGGLLESLREVLGFEMVVFTESMIKQQYRESIINNAVKL